MKRKFLCTLFIFISIGVFTFAADSPFVSISGRFSDARLEGQQIIIRYNKAYSERVSLPASAVCEVVIKHQQFSVTINDVARYGYLKILMPAPYDSDPVISTVILVASGDQVHLSDFQSQVRFAGDTKDKFNCQLDIKNVGLDLIANNGTISDHYLADNYRNIEHSGEIKRNILLEYKDKIDVRFFEILATNIRFEAYTRMLLGFKDLLNSSGHHTRSLARIFFNQFIKSIQTDTVLPDYARYAVNFCDFLFLKEKLLPQIAESQSVAGFYGLFHRINNNYTGVQKDQLIADALFAPVYSVGRDSSDHYLQKALSIVHDTIYRNILKTRIETKGKGAIAFNFSLSDTSNNIVSLRDFIGKVVVIDYYFMGCSGCALLSKAMVPVYTAFRDNRHVVFLSINIDKSFDVFKTAVKNGLYTHPETINLYTNGEGESHQLLKYYNIVGCPVLMLVDTRGRILDGDPPRPVNYDDVNAKQLVNMIQKALDEREMKERVYQK